MDIAAVMISLRPPGDYEWSCGDTLDSVVMHTAGATVPTQAECEAEWRTLGPALESARAEKAEKDRTRIPRLGAVEALAKKTKEEADKALTILALKREFAVLSQEVANLTAIVKELASR